MDVYDGSKELKVRMDDWGGRVDTYSFLVYSSQEYFHLFLCFKAFFIGGFPHHEEDILPNPCDLKVV